MMAHEASIYEKFMEMQPPQPLTEAELAVELTHNVGAMTLAEVMCWIRNRSQA
jgi:hypothetical protein